MAVFSVVITAYTIYSIYQTTFDNIVKINTDSMEEIAMHDSLSVYNSINIRWDEMENASRILTSKQFDTLTDLCVELRDIHEIITSSDYVMLLSDDGTEYRGTGYIGPNAELVAATKGQTGEFVKRYNENESKWIELRKEMLVLGVPIDYELNGVHFNWMLCKVNISVIESELKVESYEGKGFSSVIDMEGDYIINITEYHSVGDFDNFFEDMADAKFEEYESIDEIRTTTTTTTTTESKSVIYTLNNETYIMVITALDYADWYFVTNAPISVFRAQTNTVLYTIIGLLATIIFVFAIVIYLVLKQRSQAEELRIAEESSKAKTSFLFNMSHDIRTPMNAIIGFTRIAKKHIDEKDKVVDSLNKIEVSNSNLLNLINDILEMSRIEAGVLDISNEPIDIHECHAYINPMLESLAIDKSLDYTHVIKNVKNRYIFTDVQHLNRILTNIVTNAIKYTPAGGRVSFTTEQISEVIDGVASYRFTVSDTGVGMSEDFMKHMFEEFSREKTSTISKQQGTGLGLAITKRIVDAMDGRIDVSSKVNEGSTFIVTLPIQVMSEEEIEKYIATDTRNIGDHESLLRGKKALLVEDNELNREIAEEVLAEEGVQVDMSEDGALAVERIKEVGTEYYDFILMDIQMPVMNGYEATKAIRQLENGDKAVILAVSANAFVEDKEKAKQAGMNDHVAKPLNIDELIDTISKYIK